jgi:uracil-DNA glycosylase family 4
MLCKLLAEAGFLAEVPSHGDVADGDVFFTNAVLCLKKGSIQDVPVWDDFENCSGFLRSQIEIIQPKLVVCLGARPYRAVLAAFGLTPAKGLHRDAVDGEPVVLCEGGPRAVAMYDCSPSGLRNRNKEEQRQDWKRLRAKLASPPSSHKAPVQSAPPGNATPGHEEVNITRIIRDTAVTADVKRRHQNQCQVCGLRLELPGGSFYSEGAHIRPLGSPHNGPDVPGNVLCLCPNDHVLFDAGAFSLRDDLTLIGRPGSLCTVHGHLVAIEFLRHHRQRFGFEAP